MEGDDESNTNLTLVCRSLEGDALMFVSLTQANKTHIVDKVRSGIILCLTDKVLIKVTREKTEFLTHKLF